MGMPIRERKRPDHWPDDDLASLVADVTDAHNRFMAVIEDRRALMDRLICHECSRDVAYVLGALIAACKILEQIVKKMVKKQNAGLPADLQISIEDLDLEP